jgi:fumarate hydratase class I
MNEMKITLPLSLDEVRTLHAGDKVLLSGTIVTGRDMAHKWMTEQKPDEVRDVLKGGAIYHCGPIMLKKDNGWTCLAAGPTTSIREEPYLADIMEEYGVRCVIGKGGMGDKTARVLMDHGGVYLFAVGGAAVVYADAIKAVRNVYKLNEFGVPEAMWVLEVENFPLIVSMDAHGASLHRDIEKASAEKLQIIRLK